MGDTLTITDKEPLTITDKTGFEQLGNSQNIKFWKPISFDWNNSLGTTGMVPIEIKVPIKE